MADTSKIVKKNRHVPWPTVVIFYIKKTSTKGKWQRANLVSTCLLSGYVWWYSNHSHALRQTPPHPATLWSCLLQPVSLLWICHLPYDFSQQMSDIPVTSFLDCPSFSKLITLLATLLLWVVFSNSDPEKIPSLPGFFFFFWNLVKDLCDSIILTFYNFFKAPSYRWCYQLKQ